MEKLNDTIILRVSKADRERIRAKMDELGVMNMSAYIRKMALDANAEHFFIDAVLFSFAQTQDDGFIPLFFHRASPSLS